jgi:uncharacterized membrane protein YcjF (UPF0283 family)
MRDFKKLSLTGRAFIWLAVSYAVIFIVALWGEGLKSAWFLKISATYAVLIVLLAFVYLVRREFIDYERMKKDKYMD